MDERRPWWNPTRILTAFQAIAGAGQLTPELVNILPARWHAPYHGILALLSLAAHWGQRGFDPNGRRSLP